VRAEVEVVERLGTETHLIFAVNAARDGDEGVLLAADDRAMFTAVVDPRAAVAPGDAVELALDPACLHAFDPDTELALVAPAEAPAAVTPAASGPRVMRAQ
jgi:ABC-type sugar transport system ATPase subunit